MLLSCGRWSCKRDPTAVVHVMPSFMLQQQSQLHPYEPGYTRM